MNAIILAAGVGKRLCSSMDARPKCLLTFGGKTLLRRHVEMLAHERIQNIFVVVGYQADQIATEIANVNCSIPIHLVHNSAYRQGSALSLLQAQAACDNDSALVMDADVLFCSAALQRLLASPIPNCLLVDDKSVDTGEEVKAVVGPDGRVRELGKQVSGSGIVAGESIGLYKFSAQTNEVLAKELRNAVEADPATEYENVINCILGCSDMGYVLAGDLPWIEIDFVADLERAESEIWPRIVEKENPDTLVFT